MTRWTQNEQLNPQLQSAFEDQLGIQQGRSELAGGFMGRVANEYAQPFDYSGMPAPSQTTQFTNEPAFAQQRQDYTNAAMDQMRPEHQFQEEASRTRLANQGLTPGSQAYDRELQRLHDTQSRDTWGAIEQGGREQARMGQQMLQGQQQAYVQQQSARQQAIAEEAQRRGMSLNEMNALLTGQQVSNPQMPQFMGASAGQAPNYLGAANALGNYNINAAQLNQQGNAGLWGGLGQAAGTAGMIYGMGGFG